MNTPPALSSYAKGAQKIIVAAEDLIALHGFGGTSLRMILKAAGQANKSAIYLHFGSKEGLVRTIFDLRLAEIDAARALHIEKRGLSDDPKILFELIFLPVLETFKGKARERFARFVLHLMLWEMNSPIFADENEPPATRAINRQLRLVCPELSDEVFHLRYVLASTLFLQGLVQRETSERTGGNSYLQTPAFWGELIQAACSILRGQYPIADMAVTPEFLSPAPLTRAPRKRQKSPIVTKGPSARATALHRPE